MTVWVFFFSFPNTIQTKPTYSFNRKEQISILLHIFMTHECYPHPLPSKKAQSNTHIPSPAKKKKKKKSTIYRKHNDNNKTGNLIKQNVHLELICVQTHTHTHAQKVLFLFPTKHNERILPADTLVTVGEPCEQLGTISGFCCTRNLQYRGLVSTLDTANYGYNKTQKLFLIVKLARPRQWQRPGIMTSYCAQGIVQRGHLVAAWSDIYLHTHGHKPPELRSWWELRWTSWTPHP